MECSNQSTVYKNAYDALKATGLRLTKARIAVLKSLCNSEQPLSPKMIHTAILKNSSSPSIDQASIYRILEIFCEKELIHEVYSGNRYVICSRSEATHERHLIAHCKNCHKSQDVHIPDAILNPLIWYLNDSEEFHASIHHIQLDGLCFNCKSPS